LYPVETRLPPYQSTSPDTRFRTTTTWDMVCGVPLTQTDLNGMCGRPPVGKCFLMFWRWSGAVMCPAC